MPRYFQKVWVYAVCGILFELIIVFSSASAQFFNVLYRKNGDSTGHQFGYSVAIIGDVNGDTKADFVVGAPFADSTGKTDCGSVSVYSGLNGKLLYRRFGAIGDARLGHSVAGVGKIDGDNHFDFISGAPTDDSTGKVDCGSVYAFSGNSGNLIYRRFGGVGPDGGDGLGYSVAGVGKVDADTFPDFICGVPYANQVGQNDAGRVILFSGPTGIPFQVINGTLYNNQFGRSVTGIGDVVGTDGKSEFAVGEPLRGVYNPNFRNRAGRVYVYSATSEIWRIEGVTENEYMGEAVSGIGGDVSGDNIPDLISGGPSEGNGISGPGHVYVALGHNGSINQELYGASTGDAFGYSVSGIGDLNGDGKPEYIYGAPFANPVGRIDAGIVYVRSRDSGLVLQRNGALAGDLLGYDVAGGGDVDGDSKTDFIVGAPSPSTGSGYTLVFVSCPYAKGDINGNTLVDPPDVVLLMICVFQGTGNCNRCFADADCDGLLGPTDVTLMLTKVFAGPSLPCE